MEKYVFIILYSLLYLFPWMIVMLKIKRNQKVHVLWYIVILILTLIPFILFFFSPNPPNARETIERL